MIEAWIHPPAFNRSYGAQFEQHATFHGLRFAPPVANFKRRYAAGNCSLIREQNALHAVVAKRDGFLEAQLVEIDIAVAGKTTSDIRHEIEHAIELEYKLARRFDCTPFVHLVGRTPTLFAESLEQAIGEDFGMLSLSDHAAETLAAALRIRTSVLQLVGVHPAF